MRPHYGDVFKFDRLLNVFFYTSNIDKLVQARLIFMRSGYRLLHYRSQQEPYEEDYTLGTEGLLTKALTQVSQDFDVRSMFFVEDTSVRLEALSGVADYPGTRIKEWFAETSFEDADKLLQLRGGDRRAVVKSDIALRIPMLTRPIFFHGEVAGVVAESEPLFEPSVQYPWLTPETFNGWFIPDGASKRLGEMEFEESLDYDFRVKSLTQLIDRLEELNAALNFGSRHHATRRAEAASLPPSQLSLLPPEDSLVWIVIGHKCAGKTTFSDYVTGQSGSAFSLEGSTLLRNIAAEENVSIESSESALSYLSRRGWDIVASRAVEYIKRESAPLTLITGLRTVEEIQRVWEAFPKARVILVEADQRTRYERHIKRARDGEVKSFRDFQALDEEQAQFGLLRIANDIADVTIRNDREMEYYHRRIEELLVSLNSEPLQVHPESELHRSLRALRRIGRAATCDEIAEATASEGAPVRRYNTNRALKAVPEFATRIVKPRELLRYRLTPRGSALLELYDAMDARLKQEEFQVS